MKRDIRIKDPNGRIRKIKSIPNLSGLGAEAYVRVGLFKRYRNYAAAEETAIGNLIFRLIEKGWEIL